jgi:hypothetical protein
MNSEFKGEIYRHVKTGGLYVILGDALIEDGAVCSIVYQSLADGQVWVRPTKEFFDGRFTKESAVV